MALLDAQCPSSGRKSAAGEIEVGECEEREHLRAVLGNAAIAHLAIAELAFEHAEDVLDLGAHLAEAAIAGALTLRELAARFCLLLHRPEHTGFLSSPLLLVARVAFVTVDRSVVFADQVSITFAS